MPQDKSAVEEFLGDIGKSQEDPFKSTDPFAPQEETTQEETIPAEEDKAEKQMPFHKDPKILRFIEKEVAKRTPKPSEEIRPSQDGDEVTSVLERIIGNDSPEKVQAVKDFRKVLGGLEEKGAQRALAQLQQQADQERQAEVQAQEQLDNSFEEIEESHSVDLSSNTPQARKLRSEFVDYIRDIAPKNEDGEVASFPDIPAAWSRFQRNEQRAAPTNAKAKELASRGMTRSTDATVAPKQVDKSWRGIDKLFGNLTN